MQSIGRYLHESLYAFSHTENLLDGLRLFFNTHVFHLRRFLPAKLFSNKLSYYDIQLNSLSTRIGLRRFDGDYFVFYEVLMDKVYRLPVCFELGESPNILDLGGNVGCASLYFKSMYPEARIVVVEADPTTFELLEENCKSLSGVRTLQAAAWSESVELRWDNNPEAWGRSINGMLSDNTFDRTIAVKGLSMPDILKIAEFEHVDLLKVDIEGAEAKLFEDCSEWIDRVRIILIEVHGSFDIEAFENCIRDHGFTVYPPHVSYDNTSIMAVKNPS